MLSFPNQCFIRQTDWIHGAKKAAVVINQRRRHGAAKRFANRGDDLLHLVVHIFEIDSSKGFGTGIIYESCRNVNTTEFGQAGVSLCLKSVSLFGNRLAVVIRQWAAALVIVESPTAVIVFSKQINDTGKSPRSIFNRQRTNRFPGGGQKFVRICWGRFVNPTMNVLPFDHLGVIYKNIFRKLKIHQTRTINVIVQPPYRNCRDVRLDHRRQFRSLSFRSRSLLISWHRSSCSSSFLQISEPNMRCG